MDVIRAFCVLADVFETHVGQMLADLLAQPGPEVVRDAALLAFAVPLAAAAGGVHRLINRVDDVGDGDQRAFAGELVAAIQGAIEAETGVKTELSTTGGTSDGRFISRICPQVIEFGPVNATIHKIDEHVKVADIEPLKNIYRRTLEGLEALA
jgi:acetylornithine deacetylase/succinyl-diaminopimelate desuccinylase-like protein